MQATIQPAIVPTIKGAYIPINDTVEMILNDIRVPFKVLYFANLLNSLFILR